MELTYEFPLIKNMITRLYGCFSITNGISVLLFVRATLITKALIRWQKTLFLSLY